MKISLGEYVGRPVYLELIAPEDSSRVVLEGAVILAYFDLPLHEERSSDLFRHLASRGALSIIVSGLETERHFGVLLNVLSTLQTKHHVMTGTCADCLLPECVEEFLASSLPAPECFSSWVSYNILYISDGPSNFVTAYAKDIEKILRSVA